MDERKKIMTELGTKQSCTCNKCKLACKYKPGWFMPGEAELVATYLNLTLQDLFKKKLIIDWWVGDGDDIFLLSPGIVGNQTGVECSSDPRGKCIFFKNELCKIHPVKPLECRNMIHDQKENIHRQVAEAWLGHQEQLGMLLGQEPVSTNFGMFGWL